MIERHSVGKLECIFFPTRLLEFSDKELQRIASEPASKLEEKRAEVASNRFAGQSPRFTQMRL
jgi:hypothetical protein